MRSSKAKYLRQIAKAIGHDDPERYYEAVQRPGKANKQCILHRQGWRSIYRKIKRGGKCSLNSILEQLSAS